ncbi:MAG TPA: bacteriochlorophyll 4-vinyl reductase, partial [Gemmatimonadaceae bacterium]|nr:bacteriochlorophyll 4-vinyl reductase [Gemmatimonadaceae bacterium]
LPAGRDLGGDAAVLTRDMTPSLAPHRRAATDPAAPARAKARSRDARHGGALLGGARIGPNAIIQTAATLVDRVGAAEAAALLSATTPWRLDHLPTEMVDERDFSALMRGVLDHYSVVQAEAIMRESGIRTGDYLLRVRIPRLAQHLLGALPRRLGLRLLLSAITRNAWTFAGSAQFVVMHDARGVTAFELRGCPACRGLAGDRPVCHYYAATVEHLVSSIVARQARVREVTCEAAGGAACRFEIQL